IVDELAQFIRKVDGNNRMGAGTLADKICERFHVAAPTVQGEPVGVASALRAFNGFTTAVFDSSKVPEGTKLYAAPQPPSAPVGVDDGINVPAAKALIKIVGPGFKVIYRDAFRWKDASGDVLPNHYEMFSAETLARDFGYDLVLDLGY